MLGDAGTWFTVHVMYQNQELRAGHQQMFFLQSKDINVTLGLFRNEVLETT